MSLAMQTPTNPPLQSIAPPKSHQDVLSSLRSNDVKYVRIQWVDYLSQVRCRFVSLSHFGKLLASSSGRPGVTTVKAALGMVVLQLAEGFSSVGEYVYVVDLASMRTCGYAPNHAVVFGFFQEKAAIPKPNVGLTVEVPLCPRTALSRLVRYAAEELGVQFLIGFESEFVLLTSTNPIVAVSHHQWSTTQALTTGTVEAQVLEEIADVIQADGIELEMYHAEAAPGQYEVITGPMTPLEAADALVHTRETIYHIARKRGLRATFAPRLALDSCGSGAHMHVSVHGERSDLPTSPSEFLTQAESAFLSGLMHHLPSVIALTLPLTASYARMLDGVWSGGTWACWGIDQREAPIRLTNVTSPRSRNFEVRPIDGTSNPYLAVAGVLACGVLGIRDKLALTVKGCDTSQAAAQMNATERAALGIIKQLPLNLYEARRYLTSADAIKSILGVELVENFVRVNQMVEKLYDRREQETEAQAVQRLVESY